MNPLIIREQLRQSRRSAKLRPGERTISLRKRVANRSAKILVSVFMLTGCVPIRATAFRANPWLLIGGATGNPFMAAPFAPIAHHCDRNSTHPLYLLAKNIAVRKIIARGVLTGDTLTVIFLVMDIETTPRHEKDRSQAKGNGLYPVSSYAPWSNGRTLGLPPERSRSESWRGNQDSAGPATVGAAAGPWITTPGLAPDVMTVRWNITMLARRFHRQGPSQTEDWPHEHSSPRQAS